MRRRRIIITLGLGTALCGVLLGGCTNSPAPAGAVGEAFCSPEALMDLIPTLRDADGRFELPDPRTELQGFYDAHQAITRAIDVALVQSQMDTTPSEAATNLHRTMTFGKEWRSAEVGVSTDGSTITLPEAGGRFAAFGGASFLSGITPIAATGGSVYEVVQPDGSVSALVAAQPTNLPCVNRIILAEESSGGTWMPPSYALGPEGGPAFLIVDLCVDLANPTTFESQQLLAPGASIFIAMQWADIPAFAHMRTDDRSIMHTQGHSD